MRSQGLKQTILASGESAKPLILPGFSLARPSWAIYLYEGEKMREIIFLYINSETKHFAYLHYEGEILRVLPRWINTWSILVMRTSF